MANVLRITFYWVNKVSFPVLLYSKIELHSAHFLSSVFQGPKKELCKKMFGLSQKNMYCYFPKMLKMKHVRLVEIFLLSSFPPASCLLTSKVTSCSWQIIIFQQRNISEECFKGNLMVNTAKILILPNQCAKQCWTTCRTQFQCDKQWR